MSEYLYVVGVLEDIAGGPLPGDGITARALGGTYIDIDADHSGVVSAPAVADGEVRLRLHRKPGVVYELTSPGRMVPRYVACSDYPAGMTLYMHDLPPIPPGGTEVVSTVTVVELSARIDAAGSAIPAAPNRRPRTYFRKAAGAGTARVLILGDSKAEGAGATSIPLAWPALLRDKLRDAIPGGDAGVGYIPAAYAQPWVTPVPTRTAGAIVSLNEFGLGNRAVVLPPGESVTFPATSATTVVVHYARNDFLGAAGEVLIDGVVVGELTSASASKASGLTATYAVAPGVHTVVVRGKAASGGAFTLEGVTFRTAATGITLYNGAHSGFRADLLAQGDPAFSAGSMDEFNLQAIATVDPHLVVIALGANDMATYDADLFASYLRSFVDRLRLVAPDAGVLILLSTPLLVPTGVATNPTATAARYQAAVLGEFRDDSRVAVLTEGSVWRPDPGVDPDPMGYTDGYVHPSDAGHALIADMLAEYLVGGTGTSGGGTVLTPSTVPGLLDYDASTPDEPVPVVLLSDTFDRTSSSLPGSTANTGQTWAGTANAWTADGSHAIGSATGSLRASAGVGDQTLTANLSLITTGTGTAQTVRVYMRSPGGAGDGLWLAFAISNTGAWGVSVWKTIGGASTQLGSVPATTVANGSATAQAVTVTATLDGTTFTVTVTPPAGSPQTFTATIPLAEVNALTGGDVALLTLGGAAPGIRFDALTVTRPGDPLPETGGRIVTAAADGALPPLVLDALDTRYGGGSGGSVGVGALEKLRNLKGFGAGSATIAVVSDSTANDDGDWVRVWMRKWGATLPSRVRQTYSSWNEATPGWRTQVVDAAGVAPDTGVIVDDDFTRTGDVVGSTPTSGPAWTGTAGEFIADGSKVVITPTPGAFLKTAMGVRDMTLTADMIVTTTAPAAPVSMRVYISDVIWALLELQTTGFLRVGLYKTIAGVTTLIGAFKTVAGVVANSPTPQTVSITMQTAIQDITFTATAAGSTTTVTGTITESDYAALGTSAMFYVGYVSDPTYPIALDRARIKTPAADAPVAPPHLDVWNAAVAGARLSTFDATRRAAAFGGKHLDVLILSVGHNQITTGPDFVAQVESWLDEWTSEHPGCAVVVVSQNPQVSPAAGIVAHRDRQAALRLWAKGRGYDYVPAFEAFTAKPDGGASLISPDGVHPTVPPSGLTGSYGSVLWADTALAALEG